ncbi:aminotransferase class I/II-fold pyridoxal phosphate-dependent enzyme [Acerihabitans sp. TG2]|uniref:DegT/DnrJ/EryC1/StrS family aminotransferase n=1 Tax=Acerihabitans sp. TG2 TaxID=3096008 RepID=UPI002B22C7BE|nr:aminotransferase class I/II-fold pyridoxal phosphate-dependent enzyme [Acerihabitans sp. TG2]MEA9389574.1 aminotransferase class I/II-fold pyridoxal phosphate-dependent enzyme [Acerihabitans sp. TG2]
MPLSRLNSAEELAACRGAMEQITATGQFTDGDFIIQLEKLLEAFYQATTCIATSSGTDALKIALKSIGVDAGDEIIVPPNAFSATENAILSIGAKPVYANIDDSFNLNPGEIARLVTDRTKAILAVCLYGSMRNIREIAHQAAQHELRVIVDAAQCFGMPELLQFCDVIALSFNPCKNIGGFGKAGALLTSSSEFAKKARQFSSHGFAESKKNVQAQHCGLNSRMDNLQAALLIRKFDFFEINALKRSFLAYRYLHRLKPLDEAHNIILPIETRENTWHLFPIRINDGRRDEMIRYAKIMNIEFDIYYPTLGFDGINNHPLTDQDKVCYATTSNIHASVLHIPLHNHMSIEEQDKVIATLYDFFK